MMDQKLPVVYMIGVLLLALPAFLQSNSKVKSEENWTDIVRTLLTADIKNPQNFHYEGSNFV